MKKLSKQAALELGIESSFSGKQWAYVPVTGPYGFQLGIACANEAGYTPVNGFWSHADTYDEMADHADELNKERGLSLDEATRIHCSSMAAGKVTS